MLDKMNEAIEHDTKDDATPDWAIWKGEGPAPAYWYAVNPDTKEHTKVYRSYEDYVDD